MVKTRERKEFYLLIPFFFSNLLFLSYLFFFFSFNLYFLVIYFFFSSEPSLSSHFFLFFCFLFCIFCFPPIFAFFLPVFFSLQKNKQNKTKQNKTKGFSTAEEFCRGLFFLRPTAPSSQFPVPSSGPFRSADFLIRKTWGCSVQSNPIFLLLLLLLICLFFLFIFFSFTDSPNKNCTELFVEGVKEKGEKSQT